LFVLFQTIDDDYGDVRCAQRNVADEKCDIDLGETDDVDESIVRRAFLRVAQVENIRFFIPPWPICSSRLI
jgi:hypothetical protein